MSDEQWKRIQQFDANKTETQEYTKAEKLIFVFCGVVIFYVVCQILRGLM